MSHLDVIRKGLDFDTDDESVMDDRNAALDALEDTENLSFMVLTKRLGDLIAEAEASLGRDKILSFANELHSRTESFWDFHVHGLRKDVGS